MTMHTAKPSQAETCGYYLPALARTCGSVRRKESDAIFRVDAIST
jgi:hypothetical protein